jgi:hypothetical protein
MKKCSMCNIEKDDINFRKNIKSPDGLYVWCKSCVSVYNKKYRETNKEKVAANKKEYYENNREKILQEHKEYAQENKIEIAAYQKEYYQENKEEISEYKKQYRTNNSEKLKEEARIYYIENREEFLTYQNIYYQNNKEDVLIYQENYKIENKEKIKKKYNDKMLNDPNFKLRHLVSGSIIQTLKNNGGSKRGGSILDYLPYTIKTLKDHLEVLFSDPRNLTTDGKVWMNWRNWGRYEKRSWKEDDPTTWKWQLDHIIPHSTFYYISMSDQAFQDCWALSNLRPYSAKLNQLEGTTRIRHNKGIK